MTKKLKYPKRSQKKGMKIPTMKESYKRLAQNLRSGWIRKPKGMSKKEVDEKVLKARQEYITKHRIIPPNHDKRREKVRPFNNKKQTKGRRRHRSKA